MKITFTLNQVGEIERVKYKDMPDMTETVLTNPGDISDAVARVASAPVSGRTVPLLRDDEDEGP